MLHIKRVVSAIVMLLVCGYLAGCATTTASGDPELHGFSDAPELAEGKALRMYVFNGEEEGHPGVAIVTKLRGNWGPRANRYRWIGARALTGHRHWTGYSTGYSYSTSTVLVADQLPAIHEGDIVDVLFMQKGEQDLSNLKASRVIGLVCRKEDMACIEKLKATQGGRTWGPWVDPLLYDQSKFTYSPVYDETGRLPKQFK